VAGTERMAPEPTIPALLAVQAAQRPDASALVQVETERRLSFAELYDEACSFGAALRGLGVARGDRVVTVLPNSADSVLAWFGCTTIGAVETPIGTAYKGELLRRLLELADARCAVVTGQTLDAVLAVLPGPGGIDTLVVVGGEGDGGPVAAPPGVRVVQGEHLPRADVLEDEVVSPRMSDTACMLFTSGTTGNSRGVVCTFAQEYESALAAPPALEATDVVYSTSPPNHVGQKLYAYKALAAGVPFVMREAFSAQSFWSDVRRHGCTHTLLLGATTSYLLRQPAQPDDADSPLQSVMMIPLHPDVTTFRERFGLAVHSMYNMTEICPVTALHDDEIEDHRTCGRIRPGFDWRLVDDDDAQVPVGTPGQLVLRPHRPWVFAQGYWRDAEKTVDAWRNLWFHTGDMFTVDEAGYLHFLDRAKDVVRRRGENVSSAELEHLASLHPAVQECAVVGVPSEHTEEDIELVVVPRPDARLEPRELLAFLDERAPRFMLPRFILQVDELPKTPTLKVRKDLIRQLPRDHGVFDASAARP
jgi:crotonobetaine/carnitine-CoA ligase